jgi:hypothetical protein
MKFTVGPKNNGRYSKSWRDRMVEAGKCTICGKSDNDPGKSTCAPCRERKSLGRTARRHAAKIRPTALKPEPGLFQAKLRAFMDAMPSIFPCTATYAEHRMGGPGGGKLLQ